MATNTEKSDPEQGVPNASSSYQESEKPLQYASSAGEPDLEHEETEEMDRGHQFDLNRQPVCSLKHSILCSMLMYS